MPELACAVFYTSVAPSMRKFRSASTAVPGSEASNYCSPRYSQAGTCALLIDRYEDGACDVLARAPHALNPSKSDHNKVPSIPNLRDLKMFGAGLLLLADSMTRYTQI